MKLFFYFSLCLVVLCQCNIIGESREINEADYPKILGNEIDTIDVMYIAFASEGARWLPSEFINKDVSSYSNYTIFLESENEIPWEYHLDSESNRIRLIGSYYEELGISRRYVSPTDRKPSKQKVFKYTNFEILKPYLKWNENGEQILEE